MSQLPFLAILTFSFFILMKSFAMDKESLAQNSLEITKISTEIESIARENPSKAIEIALQNLNKITYIQFSKERATLLNSLSYAYYMQGDYKSSLNYAKEVEKSAKKINSPEILARSYMLQGNVLQGVNEYPSAIERYLIAIKLYKESNNKLYLGYTYNNLANTYERSGKYDSALEYYDLFRTTVKGIASTGSADLGSGDVLLAKGNPQEAKTYYEEAQRKYLSENDKFGSLLATSAIGNSLSKIGEDDLALEKYHEAIIESQKIGFKFIELSARLRTAESYYRIENYDAALDFSKTSLNLANDIGERLEQVEAHRLISKILEETGNPQDALLHLKKAQSIQDEYQNEKASNQLTVMQALFESEAKEAQIAELEEQNQMLQLEQQVSQKRTENAWLTATLLLGMLGAIALWAMLMQREKIRLAKLSQQLTVARRQAEAATEAKSAFLARMSHEIRTPINAVTGLSRLALDSQNEREQRGHLVNILDAGEILLRLVDDILDFSRIEAGKLSIECVALAPRELLKSTLNMHIVQANAKGLALVEDIAADMPRQLLGDPWRIKQILNNLVGNAIKFTEQGTVTVRLCANPAPDQPDLLMLEGAVSDTGIGLSQDQQDALFQSFSQADDSITRRFGGTGLGLAICKQLCDLMGGRIWVESEPGQGSTFRFELPLKRLAGNPQPCQDNYLPKGIPDWSQYRLLLVEDNEVNRQVAIGLLQKTAIEIQVAEHGQQALDRLKDEFFDLVLMDIQMPVMDGLTAAILIRQDLELQLPIIAMTAHAMEADRQKSVKAGMDGHLAKPIDTQTLYSLLGKYLHTERYFSLASPDAESNEPTWQVEQLAGLNVKQAIARLGGNPQLYQSLLGAFFRDQKETAGQLRQLLAQHDHSTLFRLIHSLKSSSAYIGASGLSAQCGALEAILEQGPCDPKPLLKVADDLEALLNTLAPVFESSDQSSPQAIDESELRSQLQQILALLKQSDFMVEEKLAALQKLLAGGPYAEQIARLVKKVDDVEYERAGELVAEMLAELQDAAPHHKLKVLNP